MKQFNYFKVSFDISETNEQLKLAERAEELIKEFKEILYRLSSMQGAIKAEEIPPTDADGK